MNSGEFTGRYHDAWVSKRFVTPLRHVKKESQLIIRGRRFPYPEQLTLFVYINGELIYTAVNPSEKFTISVLIPPMFRGELEIAASDVFVPKEKGINDDVRRLSFLLDEIIIPGMADLMEPYLHLFDFKPSKNVYFLEDEVWDYLSFLLDENYKIPDKDMLQPMINEEWWERIGSHPSSSVQGTVYDKFSGRPLTSAEVQLLNNEKQLIRKTRVDHNGCYQFNVNQLEPGQYTVVGRSQKYGEQEIKFIADGYGKTLHIPMLPLPEV